MKDQQAIQQSAQRTARGSMFERIGEARIEGERRRLSKMTGTQRNRDSALQRIFFGIFAVFNALVTLGMLIGIFVDLPASRIPLGIFLALALYAALRKKKR